MWRRLIRIFLSRDGQVVSDERSNTLIVKDYPSVLKVVSDFIREHDVAQPQVRVYVKFQSQESSSYQNWGVSGFQVQNGWRVAVWAAGSAQSSSARALDESHNHQRHLGRDFPVEKIFRTPNGFFTWAQNYGYISAIPAYRQVFDRFCSDAGCKRGFHRSHRGSSDQLFYR